MDLLQKLLSEGNAVVRNDHFVYKSGKHGPGYINKELFAFIGAMNLAAAIREIGNQSMKRGLKIEHPITEVGIIGPAEGAILFPLTLTEYLEEYFCGVVNFFPAKTSLDKNNRHYIKEKLVPYYQGKPFIIFEDIVNAGTTIREVGDLIRNQLNGNVIAALCFVDRGGQTAKTLNVPQYFPGLRVEMEQYDHTNCPLCAKGVPINTQLGKGKKWVELFGQPPYPKNTDFSNFWE